MKKFTRNCPECNRPLEYTSKYYYEQLQKNKSPCRACVAKTRTKMGLNKHFMKYATKGRNTGENNPFFGKKHTDATKEKMRQNTNRKFMQTTEYKQKVSNQTKGKGNPMYGRTVYEIWVEKYGKEKADELKQQWIEKQRINSSGENNPMYGKPTPQGSGNGWKGWYKGWFFRSLKELSYVVNVLEPNGDIWESAESAQIKIPYKNWQGNSRTYIPDFLVNNKLLVEVKPTKLKSSITVRDKQAAAEQFAKNKGWTYLLIDPPVISYDQIKSLHKCGDLKFTDLYEKMFIEYIK